MQRQASRSVRCRMGAGAVWANPRDVGSFIVAEAARLSFEMQAEAATR